MTEQQIEELADKVAARILAQLGDMVAGRTGGLDSWDTCLFRRR